MVLGCGPWLLSNSFLACSGFPSASARPSRDGHCTVSLIGFVGGLCPSQCLKSSLRLELSWSLKVTDIERDLVMYGFQNFGLEISDLPGMSWVTVEQQKSNNVDIVQIAGLLFAFRPPDRKGSWKLHAVIDVMPNRNFLILCKYIIVFIVSMNCPAT